MLGSDAMRRRLAGSAFVGASAEEEAGDASEEEDEEEKDREEGEVAEASSMA